jgi:uncharacterized protein YraI
MQTKTLSLAVGTLLLSTGVVSAATVTDNLNLRSGPGISYGVIGAMPAGSDIRVLRCGPSWCRVAFNDTTGYASRKFISSSGPIYAASPAAGVVASTYAASPAATAVAPGYGYGYVGYGGWRYNRYNWWNR